ncbi:unnamed protein product [Urochloa humidicola]
MLSRRGRRKGKKKKKKLGGDGGADQKQKSLLWRLSEITSNHLGKIGIGCGAGVGFSAAALVASPSRFLRPRRVVPARHRLPRLLTSVRCPMKPGSIEVAPGNFNGRRWTSIVGSLIEDGAIDGSDLARGDLSHWLFSGRPSIPPSNQSCLNPQSSSPLVPTD